MHFLILIITSYLLGSIPFGLLIAKAHGKDLRKIGSGNIGATNLARAVGKKWAYIGFAMDVSKGLLPTLAAANLIDQPPTTFQLLLWIAAGSAAVIGHIFPVYIKFKGGKGVATSLGVALGIWPYFTVPAIFAATVWALTVLTTKYISLGSIIAAIIFPLVILTIVIISPKWQFQNLWPLVITAFAIPTMVIIRHKSNIKRLINGSENRVLTKK